MTSHILLFMETFTATTVEIRLLKIIARADVPRWEQFILLINDGYQASFVAVAHKLPGADL